MLCACTSFAVGFDFLAVDFVELGKSLLLAVKDFAVLAKDALTDRLVFCKTIWIKLAATVLTLLQISLLLDLLALHDVLRQRSESLWAGAGDWLLGDRLFDSCLVHD